MTVPYERYQATYYTYQFLLDLLDSKRTPRVPKEVRLRARSLLKHYPYKVHLDIIAEKLPEVMDNKGFVYSSTKKKQKIVGN